jgi:hypothetical protein
MLVKAPAVVAEPALPEVAAYDTDCEAILADVIKLYQDLKAETSPFLTL